MMETDKDDMTVTGEKYDIWHEISRLHPEFTLTLSLDITVPPPLDGVKLIT